MLRESYTFLTWKTHLPNMGLADVHVAVGVVLDAAPLRHAGLPLAWRKGEDEMNREEEGRR